MRTIVTVGRKARIATARTVVVRPVTRPPTLLPIVTSELLFAGSTLTPKTTLRLNLRSSCTTITPILMTRTSLTAPGVHMTGLVVHAEFLGTLNPVIHVTPKHWCQGYLNSYSRYVSAPWMLQRVVFFSSRRRHTRFTTRTPT